MVEPVTVAMISAGIAAVGTSYTVGNSVAGDSGFNVGNCRIRYPKEFPENQLMDIRQTAQWDVIKFVDDKFGTGHYNVSATGYLGNDGGALYGYPNSDHPNVPINRFIVLSLTQSGSSENMGSSLLNCNIEPWGGEEAPAEGTPEDPWVALHVHGRWDPVGVGDMQFSFKLGINTYGNVYVSNVQYNGVVSPLDDFDIDATPDYSRYTYRQLIEMMQGCNFTCEPQDQCVVVDMR